MKSFFTPKESKDYEEIITEIKKKLTNNKDKNLKYLKEMCEKYKNHKMANEIIKEIGRMIFENTSEDKQEELSDLIAKDITSHFEKSEEYIRNGDLKNAKKELENFVKTSIIFQEDKVSIPYSPRNLIEYVFCCELNQSKKVRDIGVDYSTGYCRLGSIAIEENEFNKAVEYLNEAIRFNPYNVSARFELVEAYKRKGKLKLVKEEIDKTYIYIYLPNDLSRYYRDLGYYYIEKGNFKLAKQLYVYSIRFDSSKKDTIINELQYIFSRTGDKKIPNLQEAYESLVQENIPEFFNKKNIEIILALYEQVKEDKQEDIPIGQFIGSIVEFYLKFLI